MKPYSPQNGYLFERAVSSIIDNNILNKIYIIILKCYNLYYVLGKINTKKKNV